MDDKKTNPLTAVQSPPAATVDALADRLREVRRQLSRGKPLAGAFAGNRHSPAALRAAERLDSAVRRLEEATPIRRRNDKDSASPELPWLVHVVEKRAGILEMILHTADGADGASPSAAQHSH